MTNQWFIIVNPVAGGGKGKKKWQDIRRLLQDSKLSFRFALTTHARHAIALAREAVLNGYAQLAAVGGDGTAHEVINGIFEQDQVPTATIRFALLPVGTGNDWIRTYGMPREPRQMIRLMEAGRTQLQDIGRIHYHSLTGLAQQRYFLNVAGLGYDAFVTRAASQKRRWISDKLHYLSSIFTALLQYQPTQLRLDLDGEVIEGAIYSLAIGQCRYNGGGAQFVPQAIPDDGLFAVTAFKDIATWEVVLQSPKFYTGTITNYHKAVVRQVPSVVVETVGNQPTLLEADGEFLGQTPARFEMLPQAVQVVVP